MDLPDLMALQQSDLMALQQFRQTEGLMAPQYQGSTWRVHSLGGAPLSKDSESARMNAEKPAKQAAIPSREKRGTEASRRVSVEDSSYVADRMWNIVRPRRPYSPPWNLLLKTVIVMGYVFPFKIYYAC